MSDEAHSRTRPVRRIVSSLAEVVSEGPDRIVYKCPVRTATLAYALVARVFEARPIEEFWSLLVDGKHRAIGLAQVSVGTLTSSLVHPREVFGPAIRLGAAALIVAHNHPSGDPEPSVEDLELTRRLLNVAGLLGIPLLDHIICGEERFISLRERLGPKWIPRNEPFA